MLGLGLAGAGDVDGDGYADVLIGAPRTVAADGRCMLHRGGPSGLSSAFTWVVSGQQVGSGFGYPVTALGDVNLDGYDDVAVSAQTFDNGEDSEGRVSVFLGSASGLSLTPAWTVESDSTSGRLGSVLHGIGDVDGDGRGDLLVDLQSGTDLFGEVRIYGAASATPPLDCDSNGQADDVDVILGLAADQNLNFVPDACEIVAPVPFCFGDGTGTACPCGNSGGPGRGCASSVSPQGARLAASGMASVRVDGLVLQASALTNSAVLFFQGTATVNGGLGAALGDGLRCAGGSILRIGTVSPAGGSASYPTPGASPISLRGALPPGGGTRHYQVQYRNSQNFCTSSTANFTNGVTVTWIR